MRSDLNLREANPLDSQPLIQFFSSIPIQGFLDIKISRQVDFFSFFHRLGQNFKTYILENTNNAIFGTASFVFQQKNCDQKTLNFAYACDLRIAPQRKAILSWGKYFLPQVQELLSIDQVDHIVTSINLTESQVINAFIRPKLTRTDRPVYELVQKYNLVTIHGFYPLQFSTHKKIFVSKLDPTDKDQLINYMSEKLRKLEMVPTDYLTDLNQAIQKSLLFSWNQFVVATNAEGQIVGCTYPVGSTLLQEYFPQKYNQQANNFRQFLKLAAFLKFGRKLTKPFSSTNKEQTLNFKILHFLFFDHPEVLNSMISFSYKMAHNNEFLIYAYQPENFLYRPPIGTIHSEIPYAFYEIKPPESKSIPLKQKIQKFLFLDGLWF